MVRKGNSYEKKLAVSKYPDAHPLFHSNRGFRYTSKQFKARLDKAEMTQSMLRVGRCIDNGPMEGFWGIIKCEMFYLNKFKDYNSLPAAIERYVYSTITNADKKS